MNHAADGYLVASLKTESQSRLAEALRECRLCIRRLDHANLRLPRHSRRNFETIQNVRGFGFFRAVVECRRATAHASLLQNLES